jgi:hypothetical protein
LNELHQRPTIQLSEVDIDAGSGGVYWYCYRARHSVQRGRKVLNLTGFHRLCPS